MKPPRTNAARRLSRSTDLGATGRSTATSEEEVLRSARSSRVARQWPRSSRSGSGSCLRPANPNRSSGYPEPVGGPGASVPVLSGFGDDRVDGRCRRPYIRTVEVAGGPSRRSSGTQREWPVLSGRATLVVQLHRSAGVSKISRRWRLRRSPDSDRPRPRVSATS